MTVAYEEKLFHINYPLTEALTITLKSPVERENNNIHFTILIPAGKRFRQLAKGIINIYRKYFFDNKFQFEKWLYLTVNQTQIEQMSFNTDIIKTELSTGQIHVKGEFFDPISNIEKGGSKNTLIDLDRTKCLREAFKNKNKIKESVSATNTDRFRALVEGSNKSLRKFKKGKTLSETEINDNLDKSIKDDLSDFSLSQIDLNEDEPVDYFKLNEHCHKLIDAMKEYLGQKANKEIVSFPKEIEKQDELLNSLKVECNVISQQYEKMISNIKAMNLDIKHQTKDLYIKYKEKKTAFRKQRKQLNTKNLFLVNEVKVNQEMNKQQKEEMEKVELDIHHFSESPMLKLIERDEDTNIMIDILMDFINNKGETEINKGLNANQKSRLKSILASREILDNESDKYISAIEEIVNRNFQNKMICKIKIEQINSRKYKFDDKEVTLKFDQFNILTGIIIINHI